MWNCDFTMDYVSRTPRCITCHEKFDTLSQKKKRNNRMKGKRVCRPIWFGGEASSIVIARSQRSRAIRPRNRLPSLRPLLPLPPPSHITHARRYWPLFRGDTAISKARRDGCPRGRNPADISIVVDREYSVAAIPDGWRVEWRDRGQEAGGGEWKGSSLDAVGEREYSEV